MTSGKPGKWDKKTSIREWVEKYLATVDDVAYHAVKPSPIYGGQGYQFDTEDHDVEIVDTEKLDIWLDGFEAGLARRDPQAIPTSVARDVELILAKALLFATHGQIVEITEHELHRVPKPKVRIASDPARRTVLVQVFESHT